MKRRYLSIIMLIGAMVFLGMPSSTLKADFENDTRDIVWQSSFDDRVQGDYGGIFEDHILSSSGNLVLVGLHTDVYDPNDDRVNHFNGLIATYDLQGNLIKSLELVGPNGSKSYFTKVIELSNGNFVAVGINQEGLMEESGKIVVFDANLNVISSQNFESTLQDYTYASFLDVKETSAGILVGGTITRDISESVEMATFLFDHNLNLIEEVSLGRNIQNSTMTNVNLILESSKGNNVIIGNIDANYDYSFVLFNAQAGRVDVNTDATSFTQYDGYVMDAKINKQGNVVALVALDDGGYRVRQFDSSLNPIGDVAVALEAANYTNLSITEDNKVVVSGEKDGKMHYVISNGQETGSHTYDIVGIIENTVDLPNGRLVSVGYNKSSSLATVMNTAPTYTVAFDGVEESLSIPTQNIFKGGLVSKPIDPIGFTGTFQGWYEDVDLTIPFDFNTPVEQSLTLYAKWGINEMVLEHDGDIDQNLAPTDSVIWISITRRSEIVWNTFRLVAGDAPSITPLGQELGVKFEGWQLVEGDPDVLFNPGDVIDETIVDLNDYPQGGQLTLKAVYSRPSYTVTIKDTEDSMGIDFNVYHGEKLSSLNHTPVNDGFVFEGYTNAATGAPVDFNSRVISDITIVANWSKPGDPQTPKQTLNTSVNWIGGGVPRPEVTVNLYANDKLVSSQILNAGQSSLQWRDVDVNDSNGDTIVYSVKVNPVTQYQATYDGLDVTLTYIPLDINTPDNGNQSDNLPQTGVASDSVLAVQLVILGGLVIVLNKMKKNLLPK